MEDLIVKLLGMTVLASGSIAVALSQAGVVTDAPLAKDPLQWAFMTVVGIVVFGCGWVVKFALTRSAKRDDDMASAISKLAEALQKKNER